MRIVFMGTPEFAVPSLFALHREEDFSIKAVVTQPDRPAGRGKGLRLSAVKKVALELNLPILQEESINHQSSVERLMSLEIDALVVVAFGQIIKDPLLSLPPYGCINLHASLLPKYRGAAPIQWALISGEKETGVTTILLDRGVDSGDILLQERVCIKEGESAGDLHHRLAPIGANLLVKTLIALKKKELTPYPQDESEASYAPLLTSRDGLIHWKEKALTIHHLILGLDPYPGAYTYHHGRRVKIFKSYPLEGDTEGYSPGEIISSKGEDLICATGEGLLALQLLQPAGKKKMSGCDYFHGYCCQGDSLAGEEK